MEITLLTATPLISLVKAARISHDSTEEMDSFEINVLGPKDKKMLTRILKNRHDSILEHVVYQWRISGVSRAFLQEWSRHRFVSQTVESTRYTLRKFINQEKRYFTDAPSKGEKRTIVNRFCVVPPDAKGRFYVETYEALRRLYDVVSKGADNDTAKYLLPESWKTKLIATINARELDHIISLRTGSEVLWEFREVAFSMHEVVHDVHRDLWQILDRR